MNIKRSVVGVVFVASLAFAVAVVSAEKDKDKEKQAIQPVRGAQVHVDVSKQGVTVKIGKNEMPVDHVFRSTMITNMPVRNSDGDELGQVEDMVLNFDGGDVRYAALAFGGFLGFDEKLFAIPLSVMGVDRDATTGEPFLVFDVTAERLKESPGFDRDNWPDVANPIWAAEIDKFYGVKIDDKAKIGVTIRGGKGAVAGADKRNDEGDDEGQPADANKKNKDSGPAGLPVVRASKVVGLAVKNDLGEKLGTTEDMVIDMQAARVTHVVFATGGFLGLGEKQTAVPHRAINMRHDAQQKTSWIVLPISREKLKTAPYIGDQWPNLNRADWSEEFDAFFAPGQANRQAG